MNRNTLDLTPDPKVLVALTATPLQPLDALCELIDNSIDSFDNAIKMGKAIDFPLIVVDIPGGTEVERGTGIVRVRDNGPGMDLESTQNALRAGYSGKRRYGSLGLFGMGFNIASGKLGRRTTVTSTQANGQSVRVEIDLPKMIEAGTYEVPFVIADSTADFPHGTKVEVELWWPEGSQNAGFIGKLASYPKSQVRANLGRRYATILRKNQIRMVVNGEPCVASEHCVWDKERSVERKEHGRIPAQFHFDQVVHVQSRCIECDQLLGAGESVCVCGSQSHRTVEERVRGWVGIQRFDSQTDFGIDLIRNGRSIRIAEKTAFFEFTDEFGATIKDYPIDSPFGRIVGEVHLDHVPVDYTKQDFERNSDEWRRATRFLRGESSLQPTQPNADRNTSPVYKLYQGYRRVRNFGTRDMYMGFWEDGKAKRISRDVERDYYAKFLQRIPGFHDDFEWWKLVLQADTPPAAELVECTNEDCKAQNIKGVDACTVCGTVLVGKDCISCGCVIAASALSCPSCGSSQLPEVVAPWRCAICDDVNAHDVESCTKCGQTRGALNSASQEFLTLNSDKDDTLSVTGLSIQLSDGTSTQPIDLRVHVARRNITPRWQGENIPLISFRSSVAIDVFVDTRHRLFTALQVPVQAEVALEAADYLFNLNSRLGASHGAEHTIPVLHAAILDQYFSGVLEENYERVRSGARSLFTGIKFQLSKCPSEETCDLFETLSEEQGRALAANMIGQHRSMAELSALTKTSEFLRFVDDQSVVDIFRRRPRLFFDGRVFSASYEAPDIPAQLLSTAQAQLASTYLNCLEDLAQFGSLQSPSKLQTRRAAASLELLQFDFD